jgi:hypothetical protein
VKIVLTLLCRDEEDIINETIFFHLKHGVDQIIVTDNASHDATPQILARYAASGRVRVLNQGIHNHDQAAWVSQMAEIAWRDLQADWIIHSDADEFWWSAHGDLKTALLAVPPGVQALSVHRTNFLPPATASNQPFHQRQTLREVNSRNSLGQPLPPKVCHRAADAIWVHDGNHAISKAGHRVNAHPWPQLEILHFPFRSLSQYERKIRRGAEALSKNLRVGPSVGATWRSLCARLEAGEDVKTQYNSLAGSLLSRFFGRMNGSLVRDRRLQRFFNTHGH